MSWEISLARVLDRDGLYWGYPGEDDDDPTQARLVEVRVDVPADQTHAATAAMAEFGWALASKPDSQDEPFSRLYFRRIQDLTPASREQMLGQSLKTAYDHNGRFHSWIEVEEGEA